MDDDEGRNTYVYNYPPFRFLKMCVLLERQVKSLLESVSMCEGTLPSEGHGEKFSLTAQLGCCRSGLCACLERERAGEGKEWGDMNFFKDSTR